MATAIARWAAPALYRSRWRKRARGPGRRRRRQPARAVPEARLHLHGALSPAGDRVVVSGPARGYRLLIADLPDGEPRELTPDHPESFVPQFTPDGKTVVFLRRDGDIYCVDPDGKNLRRLTEGNQHVEFRLSANRESHPTSQTRPHAAQRTRPYPLIQTHATRKTLSLVPSR